MHRVLGIWTLMALLMSTACHRNQATANRPPRQRSAPAHEGSLDVNRDGVVNEEDVRLLMQLFIDVGKNRIQPLLIKAGIEIAQDGHLSVLGPAQQELIRTRLTPVEQRQLAEAIVEAQALQRRVYAAMEIAIPGSGEIFRKLQELQRSPLAPRH